MKILFKTFSAGHTVSDREYKRLKKGFAKVGMELSKDEKDPDIVMVKGFSHIWDDVKDLGKPIVMYSIGAEWKLGIDFKADNEPIRELYLNANAVIHISNYCKKNVEEVFGPRDKSYVIIPGCEPNLPVHYANTAPPSPPWKLASTAIWREVKRLPELKRVVAELNKFKPVELVISGPPEGPMINDLSFYHDCHIYVQVSRTEGMPNTVLEAIAHGLPCLVTNHGGAKEAVGMAGEVIQNDPPDDVLWDPHNLGEVSYEKFRDAFMKIYHDINKYRREARARAYEISDANAAKKFKIVFSNL